MEAIGFDGAVFFDTKHKPESLRCCGLEKQFFDSEERLREGENLHHQPLGRQVFGASWLRYVISWSGAEVENE